MAFDPITGEPIEDNKEEILAFDPMTGEPIRQQSAPEPEAGGFDPMTGKPLGQKPVPTPEPEAGGFDPMTGKPLGQKPVPTPEPEAGGFDPMTGEPIRQQSAPEPEAGGFDPMTGKPLGQKPAPTPEPGGFDPMTGKPLGQKPVPTPEPEAGGFDPMTGKPLGQKPAPEPEVGGFDPMTGKPLQNGSPKKNKKGKKIKLPVIIGAVVAAVAVIFVIVAVTSGLFLGKAGKVLLAAANTFKDRPHFVETFQDTFGILSQEKYTISMSGEINSVKLNGEMRYSGTEKQFYAQASRKGDTTVDLLASVDTKSAKLQVPQLSNYVFVYDYNKSSTGYLADELGDDSVEMLNSMLKSLTEKTDTRKLYSELFKICKDELKSMKFTDAGKEEFTIDEKDVSCKGYKTVVTSSNMVHIVDQLEKLIQNNYASLMEPFMVSMSGMSYYGSYDANDLLAETFDEMREELEYMDDIELSFYVYKNKLAGIVLYVPDYDEEVEISFEGGDYRMQNMTLKMDDERIKLIGSDEDSKETFKLEVRSGSYRETLGKLEYDYENGKFSFELDGLTASGKMTSSSSEVSVKISSIGASYYSMSPNLDITVKKGVKMEKFDGKEFDLGKADEDDYMDLLNDIQDKVYDKDLDWITYVF